MESDPKSRYFGSYRLFWIIEYLKFFTSVFRLNMLVAVFGLLFSKCSIFLPLLGRTRVQRTAVRAVLDAALAVQLRRHGQRAVSHVASTHRTGSVVPIQ